MEIIINCTIFKKVLDIVSSILYCNYFVSDLGMFWSFILILGLVLVIEILVLLFIFFVYRFIKYKNKRVVSAIVCICLFLLFRFILIEVDIFSNKDFNKSKYIDYNKYVDFDNFELRDRFSYEYDSFYEYESQYEMFLSKYSTYEVKFLEGVDYYFFGFGNRRKLLFHNSFLIDIDSGEVLYSFDLDDFMVIPNLYTVIMKSADGEYIKVYEDNYGVHYVDNNRDFLIEGTGSFIDLFSFDKQEYSNIKRVLYGEILFNIRDSAIYPNILVYDFPWYRDAAIGSMVLKYTNNSDLIKEWVLSIDSLYDGQNRGVHEIDNLGELLYIISNYEGIRRDLVDRIIEEGERVSSSTCLSGIVDYEKRELYPNLWY